MSSPAPSFPEDMRERAVFQLNKCPNHGTLMLSIDKGGIGSRIAGPKCCGRWLVVHEWPMSQKEWREVVIEIESEALDG